MKKNPESSGQTHHLIFTVQRTTTTKSGGASVRGWLFSRTPRKGDTLFCPAQTMCAAEIRPLTSLQNTMPCRNSRQSCCSPSPHCQGGVREGGKPWRFSSFCYSERIPTAGASRNCWGRAGNKKQSPALPRTPEQNQTRVLREGPFGRGRGKRLRQHPPVSAVSTRSSDGMSVPRPLGERLLAAPARGPRDTSGEQRGGPGRAAPAGAAACGNGGVTGHAGPLVHALPPPRRARTNLGHPRCPGRSSASGGGRVSSAASGKPSPTPHRCRHL